MAEPMEMESIDEKLYSRQLYVLGREGQKKMASSRVLILGVNGLGAEVAKNVILAGVQAVTLCDPTPTSWSDVGASAYARAEDLGKPRAEVSSPRLAALNPYVSTTSVVVSEDAYRSGDVSTWRELVRGFAVAVMCAASTQKEAEACDAACREAGVVFVWAETAGPCAKCFCDFGPGWMVQDVDGEEPTSCLVASVTATNPALVTVVDDRRHGLEKGDLVKFTSCVGLDSVNDREFQVVSVSSPHAYEIALDATALPPYVSSGYATKVKKPKNIEHKALADLYSPEGDVASATVMSDFAKFERPATLHAGFHALRSGAGSVAETAVAALTAKKGEAPSAAEVRALEVLEGCAGCELAPVVSFLGGVVGQEALKACTGKFVPVSQFLYYDCVEAVPKTIDFGDVKKTDHADRYASYRQCFGSAIVDELRAQRYFLVGAGAIGCEMLKNFALMGLGTDAEKKGGVVVTDMDRIEKSNLSRQLLFRASDIGKAKASAASAASVELNPEMRVDAKELRVGAETEDVFDDAFYAGLDGVCNALDNVDARLYMDAKCVFYGKPMLESGTLGTKGNTQVVVPKVTEPYSATRDPPEQSVPVCTLKNFPNRIEHTLQWARDYFEGAFKQAVDDVNAYLHARGEKTPAEDAKSFGDYLDKTQPGAKVDALRRVKTALVDARPRTFDDCLAWARLEFQACFHDSIAQLLHNFPADQLTSAGAPFWSGAKRAPTVLHFDPDDQLHLDYVKAAAALRAHNYGIFPTSLNDDVKLKTILAAVKVPEFKPRDGVKISATDAEEKEAQAKLQQQQQAHLHDDDIQCAELLAALPAQSSLAGMRLQPCDFDKDDDAHMAFVAACSNLRARNYKIPEADVHQSRLIAGKIIPAIATTTALVAGLVCVELLKLVRAKVEQTPPLIEDLKCGFANLALPLFAFSEPQPPARHVAKIPGGRQAGTEWNWSCWDAIDILDNPDMTLKQLVDFLADEYGLELSMLSHGVSILFSSFAPAKAKQRMPMTIKALVESVTKKPIHPSKKFLTLELMLQDDDFEEVELPYIRFQLF